MRRGAEPVGATASESRTEFKALVGSSREAKIEGRSPRPLRQRLLSALPRLQKGWWPVGRLVRRPWRWPLSPHTRRGVVPSNGRALPYPRARRYCPLRCGSQLLAYSAGPGHISGDARCYSDHLADRCVRRSSSVRLGNESTRRGTSVDRPGVTCTSADSLSRSAARPTTNAPSGDEPPFLSYPMTGTENGTTRSLNQTRREPIAHTTLFGVHSKSSRSAPSGSHVTAPVLLAGQRPVPTDQVRGVHAERAQRLVLAAHRKSRSAINESRGDLSTWCSS